MDTNTADASTKDGKAVNPFRYEPGQYDEKEVVTFTDSTGEEKKTIHVDCITIGLEMFTSGFIPDIRKNLKKIKAMECREDDVYICAFMKSGSNMGTWFDYTLTWESAMTENKDLDVFMIYYEDIKKSPITEIKRLATFLNVDVSDELCGQISEKCNFQNLKKANEEIKDNPNPEMGEQWKNMYRKGEISDWKNYFTIADNEYFDAVYAEKMKDSKFTYKYE